MSGPDYVSHPVAEKERSFPGSKTGLSQNLNAKRKAASGSLIYSVTGAATSARTLAWPIMVMESRLAAHSMLYALSRDSATTLSAELPVWRLHPPTLHR